MKKKLLLLSLLLLTGCGSAAPVPESTPEPLTESIYEPPVEETPAPTEEPSSEEIIESSEATELHWVLNTKSKKIHRETCSGAKDMKEENKEESDLTIEELEKEGYTKCGNCFK